jgi:hypothetical protein
MVLIIVKGWRGGGFHCGDTMTKANLFANCCLDVFFDIPPP